MASFVFEMSYNLKRKKEERKLKNKSNLFFA